MYCILIVNNLVYLSGSYRCEPDFLQCGLGLQEDEHHNCIDIDECELGTHDCPGNQ